MKRKKFYSKDLIDGDNIYLSPELDQLITEKTLQADENIDEMYMRMQIRWGREQMLVVRRAALLMGIPYQTYVKHVVFKQALEDIEKVTRVRKEIKHD